MFFRSLLVLCGLCSIHFSTSATLIGGVEFPGGASSFADQVISYNPLFNGGPAPALQYQVSSMALGVPDFNLAADTGAVSLGSGGVIVLKFTDNSLTGSGNSNDDLWIFEVGPNVESTFVWISKNGIDWNSIGGISGSTRGIDIDAFGFGTSDFFSYVKLQDDPNQGNTVTQSQGADIDAVGAIATAPPVPEDPVVPEPFTLSLVGLGLTGIGILRRRK